MKRYDIYYETKNKIIEKKNVSIDEMHNFITNLHENDEHILRIHQVQNERDDEER